MRTLELFLAADLQTGIRKLPQPERKNLSSYCPAHVPNPEIDPPFNYKKFTFGF
jgi:hypothetical protein